ncbi:MAG: DEAD/DEAH box helicase [Acidimicrobiales bacterium]
MTDPVAALLGTAGIEATFVPSDPPRSSWLALWHPAQLLPDADASLRLALPIDERIVATEAAVRRVSFADAIDALVAIDPTTVGASVAALATAVRWALGQIAAGSIRPGLTPSGRDTWQLGPLAASARADFDAIAAAYPAAGRATISRLSTDADGRDMPLIPTGRHTVEAIADAVADTLARTSALPQAVGHDAFATTRPVTIDARAAIESYQGLAGDRAPLVTLRLRPPSPLDLDGDFTASLAFQHRDDASVVLPVGALWEAPPRIRERLATAEAELWSTLRRAAKIWLPIGRFLDTDRPSELKLDDDEVDELLGPIANRLGAVGLSILAPNDLFAALSFRPVLVGAPTSLGGTRLDLSSLLELQWEGSLDGEQLTDTELAELARSKRSLIRLRGQWIKLDDRSIQRMRERRAVAATSAVAAALGSELVIDGYTIDVSDLRPLRDLAQRLRSIDSNEQLSAPEALDGTLRPYQERGLAWLDEMDRLGLGGILADDMGLGKTVQVIALHLTRMASNDADRHKPMLVICPASVVGNWERETKRFAPGVRVIRYHGATRTLPDDGVRPSDVVLTTYGVARRDRVLLADTDWGIVITDEAQAIKNPNSHTARAMRAIGRTSTRIALTGTPVQNQLTDLWAILDWTTPGLLGPLERFRSEIATAVERDRDPVETERLNQLLRPFLLRRRKTDPDIAPDLPPKTETNEIVPLTVEQAALYRAVVDETMANIAGSEGFARRGLVLGLVTRLKQVCNHPAHFLGETGPLPRRSGKLTAATELLEVIRQESDAALVFTQYVAMAELLDTYWQQLGFRTLVLHGGLSLTERDARVAAFQRGEADVFIISLRAGGVGLNLTAATHVLHYDRWWNPAVEDQASDRAWRIGQTRPVQIHRLVCEGTIEDRIAAMLDDKRGLADAVVGSGEEWISQLSDDELERLVSLSGDRYGGDDFADEADLVGDEGTP